MSLTRQMSTIVAASKAARAARHDAVGRIRAETARHLAAARAAHKASAAQRRKHLAAEIGRLRRATRQILGAAESQVGSYRKARLAGAAKLRKELSTAFKATRTAGNARRTATWKALKAEYGARRKATAGALQAIRAGVSAATAANRGFLADLAKDRAGAALLWHGRLTQPAAKTAAKPVMAAPEPVAAAPVAAAPAVAAPAEPAPAAEAETVKAEPAKVETSAAPASEPPKAAQPAKSEPPAKVEAKAETKPVVTSAKPRPAKVE